MNLVQPRAAYDLWPPKYFCALKGSLLRGGPFPVNFLNTFAERSEAASLLRGPFPVNFLNTFAEFKKYEYWRKNELKKYEYWRKNEIKSLVLALGSFKKKYKYWGKSELKEYEYWRKKIIKN